VTWRDRAACAGMDPDLFFPADNDFGVARAVCSGCPVRVECLEDALRYPKLADQWGMFAGLLPSERDTIRRARRKAQEGEAA
jgi:WhiB family transcriptional regulator, redox-sensing transcriptional regulator